VIDLLFNKGKTISAFPVKVLYHFTNDSPVPLQAGVTVGSRVFKKAVQRNRVKRLLREAYRLQKQPLQQALILQESQVVLFFIYIGKDLPVYAEVYDKVGIILQKVLSQVTNNKAN
jgi:ribonuclease P protein component